MHVETNPFLVIATIILSGTNISIAKAEPWQPIYKDSESTTYLDIGSVVYTSAGQNRVAKVVKNLHEADQTGIHSILWYVEFECERKERYRLTSAPVIYEGKMATGKFQTAEHSDFEWRPIFNPFDEAQFFACAMAP